MSRKSARETLFKLTYEFCIKGARNEYSLSVLTDGADKEDFSYINECYDGIITNYDFLIDKIGNFSQDFAFDRIYKVDLALLLVAAYEIHFRGDIPASVSANEATELSKIYSTDKSYSFVNGILASIIKEKNNVSKTD